jgi:multicomponent Na+:H+ antiporter subunit C
MTQDLIYSVAGVGLFAIGLFGLIVAGHIVRKLVAVNMMGIGVFMLFLATALHDGGTVDPIPHALVLTGIVVAVAGTCLCLWLAISIGKLDNETPKHRSK